MQPRKEKILVVDDEKDILELISFNLSNEGYRIVTASTGEEALSKINEEKFNLLILDLMLPGVDGFEICKIVKSDPRLDIPIIMLTARSSEIDKVMGLEYGADHYVTKPYSPRELVAIVKSVLRRKTEIQNKDEGILEAGPVKIHRGKHVVYLKNKSIHLTNLEYNILIELIKRPGWVLSRERIIESTRGEGIIVTDRTVDVHIVSLRKKMEKYSDLIETVRGVGYKFNAE